MEEGQQYTRDKMATHATASVFINDNESGLHHDYDVWLEKLAPRHLRSIITTAPAKITPMPT
jgi:thiamine phosphate synthase YjbQ (UPF0047 family)